MALILFYDDWQKHKNAIADMETKNKSFLRLATLYRDMGIKNHAFILQLHDRGLQGVDPYDPNLEPEMMVRVAIECKNNLFYFLREVARDPAGSSENPIPFRANRANIGLYWSFLNSILTYLIQIRQTGKSFGVDWLYTWLLNLRLTKTEISHLTKDEKLRGRELERLKAMELTLPEYLKQRGPRDPGNTEVLKISSLENYFKAYLPNKSPKIADIIGRGMTSPIVGCDEFAYIFNNFITIPVMLSATLAAREVSRMKNEPYGTIFATTSGKRDTPEGKYAFKMVMDAAVWSEAFYDSLNREQLHERVKKSSPGGKVHLNLTFNHRQLGYTDQWLHERLTEAVQEDPVQIAADYFNEWPSGTTQSPFTQEVAKLIRESERFDYFTEFAPPEAYALRWYYAENEIKDRLKRTHHILSADPSEAIGSDAIGLTLRNIETGEIAMAADISEGNLILFCRWLASFMLEYKNTTLIIERRSTGAMILDYLIIYLVEAGEDPFRRIYNQVVQFSDEQPNRYSQIQNTNGRLEDLCSVHKKLFGWATSGSGTTSRKDLYSRTLTNATRMTGSLMKDRKLILQTLGLEIRNGRVDHSDGENDDLVIAFLLSYWLLTQGKNLRHYGIDSSKILTNNPQYLKNLEETSHYDRVQHQQARVDVDRLIKEIKEADDEYLIRRLEHDLELAVSKLSTKDQEIVSADDLINKLRSERKRNTSYSATYGYQYGNQSSNYGYGY